MGYFDLFKYYFSWTFVFFVLLLSSCTSPERTRRVLVIHSYEQGFAGYPEFNKLIDERFRKNEIDADIHTAYLDCDSLSAQGELEFMRALLESLAGWKPEVILVNEDQATYSLLSCGHPLTHQIPIVFAGVNYPNWKLIKKFDNVTGFHDKPDYVTNIREIEELAGGKVNIYLLQDYTYLDRQIRKDVADQTDPSIKLRFSDKALSSEIPRCRISSQSVLGKWGVKVALDSTTVLIRSVRNDSTGGVGLIWELNRFDYSQYYLQTKRDFTTCILSNMSAQISFATLNEAMGEGEGILSGYLTSLDTQVNEEVDAAVHILNGTSPHIMAVMESKKEYIMNWEVMKKRGISVGDVPDRYRIIHIPFYERYRILTILTGLFTTTAILSLIASLLFMYRREHRRKKCALEELRKEKSSLALALEGGNAYNWSLRGDEVIISAEFWKSMGIEPRELTVADFRAILLPEQQKIFDKNRFRLFENGKHIVQYLCNFSGSGYIWVELRYRVLIDSEGKIETSGLLTNVQAQKEREQELIEARELAEKAELKQSFLANMSHEIRTPLNAIVGFSNILAADEDLPESERQEYVETINHNSDLLLKLINDILELSRIESDTMAFESKKYPVEQIIEEIYRTFSVLMPANLTFLKEESSVALEIEADKDRLVQVLTNLLNNAGKFTKEGYVKLGYTYVEKNSEVHIFVEDTGIGIPKEEQKMIFGRFYKQDEFAQGTGLGLSICYVIIEKLGGRMELRSEPGQGSRFTVVLPCIVKSSSHQSS